MQASTSSSHESIPGSSGEASRSYSDPEAGSSKIILPSMNMPCSSSPAPLQQLDSFTTVFSSPPSTPLTVVSNLGPIDSASSSSSSSSSGSSSESSPQHGEPSSPEELDREETCHEPSSRESCSEENDIKTVSETNSQTNPETVEKAVTPEEDMKGQLDCLPRQEVEDMEVSSEDSKEVAQLESNPTQQAEAGGKTEAVTEPSNQEETEGTLV